MVKIGYSIHAGTSSQSEGYSSKWLIWLVCREPLRWYIDLQGWIQVSQRAGGRLHGIYWAIERRACSGRGACSGTEDSWQMSLRLCVWGLLEGESQAGLWSFPTICRGRRKRERERERERERVKFTYPSITTLYSSGGNSHLQYTNNHTHVLAS